MAGISDADPTPAANNVVSAPQGMLQEFQPLVGRARRGDWKVLPQLRQLLEDRTEIWQHFSQLGQRLEKDWLDLLSAGQSADVVDVVQQEREALWGELLGQHSTRLERLLAQRIAANWMAVHYFEQAILLAEGMPAGRFLQQCLARAERSHQHAEQGLGEFRRLLPRIGRRARRQRGAA